MNVPPREGRDGKLNVPLPKGLAPMGWTSAGRAHHGPPGPATATSRHGAVST